MTAIAHAQEADLSLEKTVSAPIVAPGSALAYTLTVENHGPDLVRTGTVEDELSPHVVFVSASSGCSYDDVDHTVSCGFAGTGPGMSVDFQIEVTVDALPADAEIGVAITCDAPALEEPAAALIATRTGDHGLITSDDQLVSPRGIAREAGGQVLIADQVDPSTQLDGSPVIDGRVVRVDRATGLQTVLAEGGELLNPTGVVVDDTGRVFVADPTGPALPEQYGRVLEIDPADGSQNILASGSHLEQPRGIAVLGTGELAVVDAAGKLVLVDPATGDQTLVSEYGDLVQPRAVAQFGPDSVVVVDGISGLIMVEVSSGDQTVLMPIDGDVLIDPVDVEVDHLGGCWVADLASAGAGSAVHIDCAAGELVARFVGGDVWATPHGLELLNVVTNRAEVSSSTFDPDPSNNADWVATEVEEGYVPPLEILISERVAVTDGVVVDVITAVIIEVLETISIADAVMTLPAVFIDVAEEIIVSDVVVARPALTINVTEMINVSDSVVATPVVPVDIQVTETITVSDQLTVLPSVVINLNEAVTVSDAVAVQPELPVEIQVTETITVSDQLSVLPSVVINLNETVTVSDAVDVQPDLPVEIQVNESVLVSDQVAVLPSTMITVTEQITVTDTPQVSVQAVVIIDVEEIVAVADQIGLVVDRLPFADGFESGDTSAWSGTYP